jgi:hypothetical protein
MAGNKQNREQRRAEEFGRPDPTAIKSPFSADDLPANEVPADEATAGRPDQGPTDRTGPGTGGATQNDDRVARHEGSHATNSAKG